MKNRMVEAHEIMANEPKVCSRCGSKDKVELHHKKHHVNGGKNKRSNLIWLCQGCHDYQHAADNCHFHIQLESQPNRVAHWQKRLEITLRENTPALIRNRGFKSYYEWFKSPIPPIIHKKPTNSQQGVLL